MKRLLKWTRRLALVLAVLAVLGLISKDFFLRIVAERRLHSRTGMEARIGSFSTSVFASAVTIRDLKLYNTADFGGTLFLDVSELRLEFDPAALARGELRITLMRLNVAEIDVVRNETGQTNVFSISKRVRAGGAVAGGSPRFLKGFRFTGIDVLDLTLGKTRYIDLADARNNHECRVNLRNQIFKNVRSDSDFYNVLLLLWLQNRGIFPISPPVKIPWIGASNSHSASESVLWIRS